jgi:two-component system response regulator PilR (NtrC family)
MKKKIDILIVDDDEDIRNLYSLMLDLIPCSYKTADSYDSAIELLDKYDFRVCVLDINLREGEYNGVELAIKIRKKESSVEKIFVMTGYGNIFDDFDPNIAGIDKVFTKPTGFKFLIESIKKYLGK